MKKRRHSRYNNRRKIVRNYRLALCGAAVIIASVIFIGFVTGGKSSSDEKTTTASETRYSGKETDGETQEEKEQSKVNITDFKLPDYIQGLDSTIKSLGYGKDTERGKLNRPVIIENIEKNYGQKYNAMFIGGEEKSIYLTFTMGYEYMNNGIPNTQRVLEILKEKNVKAAFFVDGGYVKKYPEMCRKIVEEGHMLGCHGYDHPSEGVASYPVEAQIEDARKIYNAIYDVTGVEPYLYRFGSGIWSEQSLAILYEMGFKNVFYSFTYYDYDIDNQPGEAETLQKLKDNTHGGEIIYLHTVSNTSVNILDDFIDWARAEGYEFKLVQ